METTFSPSEVEFLKSLGFVQDDSKHSGFYYIEDDRKTTIIIPKDDNSYKLEFYEFCDDGDGNFYEDNNKEYSKVGQTLKEFLNSEL